MTNKIVEQDHHFNVEEATKYGIEKAILLHNIRFWLQKNKANKNNKHRHFNGNIYYWTYNSREAFGELFPYFVPRNISRWLLELEKDGVLLSGNFNKSKYDRTKWYTIKDEFLSDDPCSPSVSPSTSIEVDDAISYWDRQAGITEDDDEDEIAEKRKEFHNDRMGIQ